MVTMGTGTLPNCPAGYSVRQHIIENSFMGWYSKQQMAQSAVFHARNRAQENKHKNNWCSSAICLCLFHSVCIHIRISWEQKMITITAIITMI